MMDFVTLPFRLPFMPLRALIRLAEILRDEAERELHDPSAVRRQLEEAAAARDSGRLSDDEFSQVQREAVSRLIRQPGSGRGEVTHG